MPKLSDKEKQKIYEEEKAKLEAQGRLKAKENATGCAVLILLLFFGYLYFNFLGNDTKPTKANIQDSPDQISNESTDKYTLGSESSLFVNNMDYWYLATNEDNFTQFIKTASAEDNIGLAEMMSKNQIFKINNGTKLKIIDSNWTGGIEVRVMDGEQIGKSGWMIKELFQ
jgi:hypothetical protein